MTDGSADVSRRGFLTAAAGATATAAAAGSAAAQNNSTAGGNATDGGGGQTRPDFGGYLDDANGFTGTVANARGQSNVTVDVGAGSNGFSFDAPAIHVDAGTTVTWQWTGEGGAHNVVHTDDAFSSDLQEEEGATFEYTFEEDGVYTYFCAPHEAAGMKAAVVVGDDYPTTQVSDGAGGGNQTAGNESAGNESEGGGGGGGGPPDFGGWLDDANNYSEVVDLRGESEPTVEVGVGSNGLAFGPAAVHVDNGATVTWEWTGEGGSHNVVHQDGNFESDLTGEAGATFTHTFDEDGIYNYYCDPHRSAGMLGSVVVGSNYPTVSTPAPGGGPQEIPGPAMTLTVATGLVMAATLGMAYFFLKFGGGNAEE
jgi:halocyanin-like protein